MTFYKNIVEHLSYSDHSSDSSRIAAIEALLWPFDDMKQYFIIAGRLIEEAIEALDTFHSTGWYRKDERGWGEPKKWGH